MLQQQTIEIIKSTVPLLEQNGREITDVFYANLFANHPFLKNIFNKTNQSKGEQSRALSDAVLAYAKNIDNLEALTPVVERIAHKHASLGIQAKHYKVVGDTLLSAIQEVLELPNGHAALSAWADAYAVLAQVFIAAESNIYQANKGQDGGWDGYRDFYIDRVVEETPEVKSFYLKPMDLGRLPSFKGGQYVGVRVRPDNSEHFQIRQYSLSQQPNQDTLRISVKAEHGGVVSNYLHTCIAGDAVSLQAPTGVFTLSKHKDKHIFVTGGVGITPLYSMMQEAIISGIEASDILFVQCTRDENHLIFAQDLLALAEKHSFHHKICYENTDKGDYEGYLKQEVLENWTQEAGFSPANSQVYFCGPKPFMAVLNQFFLAMKYDAENIHYEVFGPTTNL
jgi:nitric oxide dioxygenase